MNGYTVYGSLTRRHTLVLTTTLVAKGLEFDFVEESASLTLALSARSGGESGPYLRTPEGFILSDLHAILDWMERAHPNPGLFPTTPIRRTVARLCEDWLELWLPLWPRRSWATLERLGTHLQSAGFLLGPVPCRCDWLLAGWLESEVLVHKHARKHLAQNAPRLVSLGSELLEHSVGGSPEAAGLRSNHGGTTAFDTGDDVIPISFLSILEEIAADYHGYLVSNHQACKDGADRVLLDLGLGRMAMPVRRESEIRRAEIGRELRLLAPRRRRDVRQVLEPVGAWHALTLPPVLLEADPRDPRSL